MIRRTPAISCLAGSLVACLLGLALAARAAAPSLLSGRVLMTYSDSWRENAAQSPADTKLSQAPAYLNLIALSFARPDMSYGGGLDISGAGFAYKFSGDLLRGAIALLKRRHPDTRVILSVGGGTYLAWDKLDEHAVARLVHDLGADGVDVDYERETICAAGADGRISCPTDQPFIESVTRLRQVLPRPLILTVGGWHVGAYGEGEYKTAPPARSRYTGYMLGLLRSPAASLIDMVTIGAYDAGTTYRPMQAYMAYRAVWKGKLTLGVEVPIRGATGPFYTVASTEDLARQVAHDPLGGMMVYSMLEPPYPLPATPDHPNGAMLEQAACRGLGMTGCDVPAPPPGQ